MANNKNQKILRIIEQSKQVFDGCVLENGAIVAANTDKPAYPRDVANYRYVWIRDAAFVLYANSLLRQNNADINFAKWLLTRAEGFDQSNVLFRRYGTNGSVTTKHSKQFQPDQAGSLLWVLSESNNSNNAEITAAVEKVAEGVIKHWRSPAFTTRTYDLWEAHRIRANSKKCFTYSLAAASYGLKTAGNRYGREDWIKASQSMAKVLDKTKGGHFARRLNSKAANVDGSLSGLVWPFNVITDKQKLTNTITKIEYKLLKTYGIVRWSGDNYSGRINSGRLLREEAGPWPVLTCWFAIALHELGQTEQALGVFEALTDKLDNNIPEQIPLNGRSSITPLAWSHAMYVIAAWRLGFLDKTASSL